jgi:hypothetical protein
MGKDKIARAQTLLLGQPCQIRIHCLHPRYANSSLRNYGLGIKVIARVDNGST